MMRGGGPPFVNKRCGLPLTLPLHAKKLCPDLSLSRRFGHRVLVWKTGKKPSRFCRSTSAAGVGYALRYREMPVDKKIKKSGHGRDGHVRFFAGSIPSAEALPRYGVSSAPATTKRCRGTGKDSFSRPDERTYCRLAAGAHPCMGLLEKRRPGRAIGPQGATGYRPSGRMPRRGGGSVATQETPAPAAGAMAPCLTLFL